MKSQADSQIVSIVESLAIQFRMKFIDFKGPNIDVWAAEVERFVSLLNLSKLRVSYDLSLRVPEELCATI